MNLFFILFLLPNVLLWVCQVLKVSQFNKTNERFLIVSETSIYKVDPRKHFSRIAYLKFCLNTFLLDFF